MSAEMKRRVSVALCSLRKVRPSLVRQADHSRPTSAESVVASNQALRGTALRMQGVVTPPEGVRLVAHAASPASTVHRLPQEAADGPPGFIPSC